ncbi:MAG: DUF2167 domain-containing protein [Phycisphaerales bacterium]|nr:DUF2167 domain-containing protein [Phycisphaerales bacterium]
MTSMIHGLRHRGIIATLLLFLCLPLCPARAEIINGINWTRGPAHVNLGSVATLEVPAGYMFTDAAGTRTVLNKTGNVPDGSEVGCLLFQIGHDQEGVMYFSYDPIGYVKDDEKTQLTGSAIDFILSSVRDATNQANKERSRRGFPTLDIVGWDQKPFYDGSTHNLTWAIRGRDSSGEEVCNYDSRALGRRGMMRVKMVVAPQHLQASIPTYRTVIGGISFNRGESYSEYRAGDTVAQVGLTGLITGGAAVVVWKLWKPLLAAGAAILAAIGTAIRKFKNLLTGRSASGQPRPKYHTAPEPIPVHYTVVTCGNCGQSNRVDANKEAQCSRCQRDLIVR